MLATANICRDEQMLLHISLAFAILLRMGLREYIKENGRSKIAKAIGTSPAYVSQLVHGHRTITAETAIAIERATNGAVRCEDTRPDVDWGVLRGNGAKPETDEAA